MNHVIVKQTKFNQQQGGEVIMAKNDKWGWDEIVFVKLLKNEICEVQNH